MSIPDETVREPIPNFLKKESARRAADPVEKALASVIEDSAEQVTTELQAAVDKTNPPKDSSRRIQMHPKDNDAVKSPNHYAVGGIFEVIDLTNQLNLNGNLAQSIQYITRAGRKTDPTSASVQAKYIEDLRKAQEFLEFEIRRVNGEHVSDTMRTFLSQFKA